MPVGAHRRPPSKWRPVLPFLIILLVVPLLAWGFSALLQRSNNNGDISAEQSAPVVEVEESPQSSPPVQSTPEENLPTAEPEEPEAEPEEEEPAQIEPNYETSVAVLNASFVDGYAGQVAQTIIDGGFSNVVADNTSGWLTQTNTVFYSTPEEESTAQRVAELTGIADISLDPEATGGSGIIVLLVD